MGFTVSLLIGELAFGAGTLRDEHAKVGVLTGTLLAALLAAVVLRLRDRRYRRIAEADVRDADADGVPDVFQRPDDSIPGQPAAERSGQRHRPQDGSLET